ncbi:Zn-dependent hydrolase [Streptomyces cahuitamycinicus]|uniref:Zn-dependent hydrolase n=1 Tax=Streptomyces cahuitamycinicus TaxID=2070367 RepID=A0A2N8TY71_9ACTN|nr:Zn-dependent hydrolase [Streptomyces cahuitamycinicus]
MTAIVCTHTHNDHIDAAPALVDRTGAPIFLHLDDRLLWRHTHSDRDPDGYLSDGRRLTVTATELTVLHTPGHTPGGICLYSEELATAFTGDTLFHGEPGATERSYSHFPTIIRSIRNRLLTLPPHTTVNTGHGDSTSIGAEAPHLDAWIERGH